MNSLTFIIEYTSQHLSNKYYYLIINYNGARPVLFYLLTFNFNSRG